MLQFELRDAIRNGFTVKTVDNVEYVVFNMTPVVGVVGNTYPSFLNSNSSINVDCLKSMTGDEMDVLIMQKCFEFVTVNFPPIP